MTRASNLRKFSPRKFFPAKLSHYTVFYIVYWPEEQAASLVGRGVVVSPDVVTTGYDAQVCVGQATIQA